MTKSEIQIHSHPVWEGGIRLFKFTNLDSLFSTIFVRHCHEGISLLGDVDIGDLSTPNYHEWNFSCYDLGIQFIKISWHHNEGSKYVVKIMNNSLNILESLKIANIEG